MKAYFDTSVLVAASVVGHPHHAKSLNALRAVQQGKLEGCISGHSLSETYAVLTRAPFVPPVYPAEAWQLLRENILPFFKIVSIAPRMYRQTIQQCAHEGWLGGRVYDALHLGCARVSRCQRIYTFNVRHFQELASDLQNRIGPP